MVIRCTGFLLPLLFISASCGLVIEPRRFQPPDKIADLFTFDHSTFDLFLYVLTLEEGIRRVRGTKCLGLVFLCNVSSVTVSSD